MTDEEFNRLKNSINRVFNTALTPIDDDNVKEKIL